MEEHVDKLKVEAEKANRVAEDAGSAAARDAARDVEIYATRLESAQQRLHLHRHVLEWAERERRRIQAGQDQVRDAPKDSRRMTPPHGRRKRRQQKARSVLGTVQPSSITKPEAGRQRTRRQAKSNPTPVAPATAALDTPAGSNTTSRDPENRSPRLVRGDDSGQDKRDAVLGPILPQKVLKPGKLKSTSKLPTASRKSERYQQTPHKTPARQRPLSQRVRRKPDWYVPGS
ncbi:MAG: hypothetical protein Q9201_006792 [Fulgogasparrea decipioides]